eukprot:TRINITY_DN9225_c0_g2_i2.p1 TRINITY_DN9225_c0_g2~~TRINITY_DN9225_c0_g2_i2.p1  ORF type:complete len:706 (-),score=60.70 TRINITY_DN9225_c0_g2_i2:362-2404(-)
MIPVNLIVVVFFVLGLSNVQGQFQDLSTYGQLQDNLLQKQVGLDCVLMLTADGQVGCQGSALAKLQFVESFQSFVQTESVVVVTTSYFLEFMKEYRSSYIIQKLVKGILVDSRDNPKAFSPASKFPLSEYASYDDKSYAWNPQGYGILENYYQIPVFILPDQLSEIAQERAAVNAKWGYKGGALHVGELNSKSEAQFHSDSSQCMNHQTCYPLGGYSVLASFPPESAALMDRDVILVLAQMDSRSFFQGVLTGLESASSRLVALLAAVNILTSDENRGISYNKQLLFAAMTGEPFGYMGTKSLLWQIHQGLIPEIDFQRIHTIVEFNMAGSTNSSGLYVHGNNEEILTQFENAEPKVNIKRGGGPGIPPSSTMPWLLYNSSYNVVVLSDFSTEFNTPYFWSFADYAGSKESLMENTSIPLTTDAAIAGAQLLNQLAGGSDQLVTNNDTIATLVLDLYTCLQTVTPGLSCSIVSDLMTPSRYAAESTIKQLLSITQNTQTQDKTIKRNIERFVYNYLANLTGQLPPVSQQQRCNPTIESEFCPDGMVCVGWKDGADISQEEGRGYCVNASVQFVPSWSPKFVCPECDGVNSIKQFRWEVVNQSVANQIDQFFESQGIPKDDMWTWAISATQQLDRGYFEIYIQQSYGRDVAVLVGGIMATAGCGAIVAMLLFAFEKYVKSQ